MDYKYYELMEKYKETINQIEEFDDSNFNIFKVLGCSRYEVRHSGFLSWLLHDKRFLVEFAKECGIILDADSINKLEVETEETYRTHDLKERIEDEKYSHLVLKDYRENSYKRSIDINVKSENFTITIENKIDSGEHDDQCISYYNYMLTNNEYEGKDKYFVFLAKNKPKYFDVLGGIDPLVEYKIKNNSDYQVGMKYFNYRLITYRQLSEILKRFHYQTGDIKEEIVRQYEDVLNEWEKLEDKYIEIIRDKVEQNDLLSIAENYNKWRDDHESKEMRFLDVAYRFYEQEKKRYDNEILPALEEIKSDQIGIKKGYGRGGYANALPLALSILDEDEKTEFCIERCEKYDKKKAQDIILLSLEKNIKNEDSKKLKRQYDALVKKKNKIESNLNTNSDENKKSLLEAEIEIVKKDISNKESELEYAKDEFEKINQKLENEIKNILSDNVLNKKKNLMLQTVDYRCPMLDREGKYSLLFLAGLKKEYSTELCKYIASDKFEKNYYEHKDVWKNYTLEFSYSFGNGTGFGDKKRYECSLEKFIIYVKQVNTKEISKELFIGQRSFDEAFCDDKFVDYLHGLKDKSIMSLDELERMIFDALDYFLDKEKIETCYEIVSEYDSYFEDPVKADNIVQNIQFLIGEEKSEKLKEYTELIKKKIGIINATKNNTNKDTTNKRLNFVWQLSLIYAFCENEIKNSSLKDILYKKTIEGLKLFGYDQYCSNSLLKRNSN